MEEIRGGVRERMERKKDGNGEGQKGKKGKRYEEMSGRTEDSGRRKREETECYVIRRVIGLYSKTAKHFAQRSLRGTVVTVNVL